FVILLDDTITNDGLHQELDGRLSRVTNAVPRLLDGVLQLIEGFLNSIRNALEQRLDGVPEPCSDRVNRSVLNELPGILNRIPHIVEAGLEALNNRPHQRPQGVLEPITDSLDSRLDCVPHRFRDDLPTLERHFQPSDDPINKWPQ